MYIIHALNKKTMVFDTIGFRETKEAAKDSVEALLQYTNEYFRCVITHTATFIEVRPDATEK